MENETRWAMGKLAQIAREFQPREPATIVDWPASNLLGLRSHGVFARCTCRNGTWVYYGTTPMCHPCASYPWPTWSSTPVRRVRSATTTRSADASARQPSAMAAGL